MYIHMLLTIRCHIIVTYLLTYFTLAKEAIMSLYDTAKEMVALYTVYPL